MSKLITDFLHEVELRKKNVINYKRIYVDMFKKIQDNNQNPLNSTSDERNQIHDNNLLRITNVENKQHINPKINFGDRERPC